MKTFIVAVIFFSIISKTSVAQLLNNGTQVNIVCELYNERGIPQRPMSFVIDYENSIVNGYKANITNESITYSYSTPAIYNVRIDRISGSVVIGTLQFPLLLTGNCRKVEGRAF